MIFRIGLLNSRQALCSRGSNPALLCPASRLHLLSAVEPQGASRTYFSPRWAHRRQKLGVCEAQVVVHFHKQFLI